MTAYPATLRKTVGGSLGRLRQIATYNLAYCHAVLLL
jgi:hypothetical protein